MIRRRHARVLPPLHLYAVGGRFHRLGPFITITYSPPARAVLDVGRRRR